MIIVFLKKRWKGSRGLPRASAKFSHMIGSGIHWGGQTKIWYSGFNAEVTIQKKGKTKITPRTTKSV